MLVVLAEARFDARDTGQVRAVARPMIEASRAEPGCDVQGEPDRGGQDDGREGQAGDVAQLAGEN